MQTSSKVFPNVTFKLCLPPSHKCHVCQTTKGKYLLFFPLLPVASTAPAPPSPPCINPSLSSRHAGSLSLPPPCLLPPFVPPRSALVPPTQNSSHSKEDSEDSELENIMGHHHHHHEQHDPQHHHAPTEGHPFPGHEPAGDSESEGRDSPLTPGTPTYLRPSAAGRSLFEATLEQRPPRGTVDFSLTSPISPSRPKSPWGRYDPYDASEVMLRGQSRRPVAALLAGVGCSYPAPMVLHVAADIWR